MDTQDIEPGRTRTLLIGVIREGGKSRRIYGAYYEEDTGLEDACHIWLGKFKNGWPVVQTRYSNYSPRALIMKGIGRWGYLENVCGRRDCVNIHHVSSTPWKERMDYLTSRRSK